MIATQHAVEKYSAGRSYHEVPHFALNGVVVKPCNRCGRVRPIEKYGPHRLTWDGLLNACEDCAEPGVPAPLPKPTPPPKPAQIQASLARIQASRLRGAHSRKKEPVSQPAPEVTPSQNPDKQPSGVLVDPWTKTRGGAR